MLLSKKKKKIYVFLVYVWYHDMPNKMFGIMVCQNHDNPQ